MAESTCVKCGGTRFERVVTPVANSPLVHFVQCAECGGVVAIIEAPPLLAQIQALDEKLTKILRG